MTPETKKRVIKGWPYALIFYVFNQISELFRLIESESLINRFAQLLMQLGRIFETPLLSFKTNDLLVGIIGSASIYLLLYIKGKNAKKYRKGTEYGWAGDRRGVHGEPVAGAGPGAIARRGAPALREDLRLHETAPEADGAPTWVIQDPLNNSFYRIGWLEFECLIRYPAPAGEIAEAIASTTPLLVDTEIVEDFFRFLAQHRLLRPTADALRDFGRAARQAQSRDWREWRWWLHHYLFIRFPLVKPDRFLLRSLPWVRPLVTLPTLLSLLVASLLGLILVGRQWDEFTHALSESFSPAGMLAFALAVLVSKFCHELGHAFVATRYGIRVAHMGVALVVLWPMLYTDTSESWRLRSSRQRLAVSSAGILVGLALAGVAACLLLILTTSLSG